MSQSTPQRGRPPSTATRSAILDAAFEVLLEKGYAGMSMESVATAAKAGKTTIYRWWPNKSTLAVDAFFHATQDELAFPDTGSGREDFRLQILGLAKLLRGPRGAVLAAMLGGARTDAALASALGARWLEPRRTKAIAAGECREGTNVFAALGVLYGPLYTPLLFGQSVPTEAGVEAHLEVAFAGVFR
jgi:AcrR family transcriptional regulator